MTDSPHAQAQPATQLHITLLGPPQLSLLGTPLPLPRRQLRALLYRLAATLQPVSREQLCFLLWPDIPETAARRNLTVLLNQLRQTLPADLVRSQRDSIRLDPERVSVDTVAFAEASAVAAQRAEIGPLAEALRASLTLKPAPVSTSYYNRILSTTRAQLAQTALHESWDAGRHLAAKQALAEAEAFARGA